MNILVNTEISIPYYVQIYVELKDKIESMVYKPNEMLPSENELVEQFKVTRVTVRNAIKKLKDEGRIHTEKGIGSFVNPPRIMQQLHKMYSLTREFVEEGHDLEIVIINMHTDHYTNVIKKNLQLEPEDEVVLIQIIRKIHDIPVLAQFSYLPLKVIPDLSLAELKDASIYTILKEKYNIKLLNAKEYLDPIIADDYYSKLLEVELNTPLFLTERITYTSDDRPIEFRKCVVRSDKFRFFVDCIS